MYIRMIPNKIIKNKIISTQKRKMIKFQNTTAPGQYIFYDEAFSYLIFLCAFLGVSLEFVCGNYLPQTFLFS